MPASARVTRIPYKQVSQHLEIVTSPPTSPLNPLNLMQPSTPVPTHSLLSTPTSAQSQARILTVRPGVTVKPGSRYLLTPQGKLIPHTVTPSTPSMTPQLQVIPRTVNLGATVTLQPTKPMVNLIPQTVTSSKPSRIPRLRVVPRSAGVPTSSLKPTKVKQSTPVKSETMASTDLTSTSFVSPVHQKILPLYSSASPVRPSPSLSPISSAGSRPSPMRPPVMEDVTAGGMLDTSSAVKVEVFDNEGKLR